MRESPHETLPEAVRRSLTPALTLPICPEITPPRDWVAAITATGVAVICTGDSWVNAWRSPETEAMACN